MAIEDVLTPYERTLEHHHPYVVAMPALARRLNLTPLGLSVAREHRVDPTRTASAPFLGCLERLDSLTYGPVGMVTPRWALYDCAELPGIVFGFGCFRADLPTELAHLLDAEDVGPELIPVSMYLAVPMLEADHWLGYAITDAYERASGPPPAGLRALSVVLALSLLGARCVSGTTQWRSPKMSIYARFAPLEVRAAWLPAHTDPATCLFSFDVDERRLATALAGAHGVRADECEMLDAGDTAALMALQQGIESGRRVAVAGVPEERNASWWVPVRYGDDP